MNYYSLKQSNFVVCDILNISDQVFETCEIYDVWRETVKFEPSKPIIDAIQNYYMRSENLHMLNNSKLDFT